MALARKYRLDKKSLENVFKKGKTVKSSFLFLKFINNGLSHGRAAAIVSSKVLKKAVSRNKTKKIFLETMSANKILESPVDIIIVATPSILGKTSKEINRELEQTIKNFFVHIWICAKLYLES